MPEPEAKPDMLYFLVGEPVAWVRKTVTWKYDLDDLVSEVKPDGRR